MDFGHIEAILESAKDPSEREEKMNVFDAIETTPGEEPSEVTVDDALKFSADDHEEHTPEGRAIEGECPECGSESLRAVDGRRRTDIHCEDCEKELLEHDGGGKGGVVGVTFHDLGPASLTIDPSIR